MGSDSDNANLEDGALYGGSESSLAESEEDFADKFLEDTDQSGGEGGSDRDDEAHSQQSFDLDDSEVESDVDGSLEGKLRNRVLLFLDPDTDDPTRSSKGPDREAPGRLPLY